MWPFSSMSLATATLIGSVANWALLISLVVGAVSTYIIVQATDVKERFWDEDRSQSSERIASLNRETTRLTLETETARAEIASANARALEAQAELARFRAPRLISPNAQAEIRNAIAPFSSVGTAIYVLAEGPEPNALAVQIQAILTSAGFNSNRWIWNGGGALQGVLVAYASGDPNSVRTAAEAVAGALNAAGIASQSAAWPGNWDQFGGMLNGPNPPNPTAAPMRIVIGTKP